MAVSIVRSRYTSLISGSILCVVGLAIFAYLSPTDFLEPGFVRDGILIQDQYVLPNEAVTVMLPVAEIGQDMKISATNTSPDVPLRIEIKDPDRITIYDDSKSKKAEFNAQTIGKYLVTITNIGTDLTKITVPYGHNVHKTAHNNNDAILGVLWITFIIAGSYVIVHTNIKVFSREKK